MALKIISLIFVVSLAFGIAVPTQAKDVLFDVNDVINRVSPHVSPTPNPCPLTPELTGEFLIDTSIVYLPEPNAQEYPAVAFDGTNYLVVWVDFNRSHGIYGTRVTQSGVVLDPAGIAIATTGRFQASPDVAFDGTSYLVVWQDVVINGWDILGARVSTSGEVIDPDGFVISADENDQWFPSITFGDLNYLVVWEDYRNGDSCDIYGSRVACTGTILDPNGIEISRSADKQRHPKAISNETNFMVVWQDMRNGDFDIFGAQVNHDGVVIDSNGFAISTSSNNQTSPSLASDEINCLVVWEDYRSGYFSDIYGSRVSHSGTVLDPFGIPIVTGRYDQDLPDVAFTDTTYLVVWEERYNPGGIGGARVNISGQVLDPYGIMISVEEDLQVNPAASADGNNFLVVWQDRYTSSYWDIYSNRINESGTILDSNDIIISSIPNGQFSPSVAFDGTNYLVVWEDERQCNTPDIYGAQIDQEGEIILNHFSIPICTALGSQKKPAVTFDGLDYLVVWQDGRLNDTADIYGSRVNTSGIVLDSFGIPISTAERWQYSPAITTDHANCFVVWTDGRSSPEIIYGARINREGIVLDTAGIPISMTSRYPGQSSCAFDGTNYLVVWERSNYDTFDIYGTRVSQTGVVIDSNGLLISRAAQPREYPVVAFDGINYLVVWQNLYYYTSIYGSRVNQYGIALDSSGILISGGSYHHQYPSVDFDGTNYVVVWEDGRAFPEVDIYGARFSPLGIVLDSFSISTQRGEQRSPAIASGTWNRCLIVYSGWTGECQGKTYNTYRIWGKFYPIIGINEGNSKVEIQSAKLLEVYPNPFKSQTAIRFSLSAPNKASLKIYDISGKLVKSFSTNNQPLTANNCFIWNGTDDSGKKLPAGVYICHLKTTEGLTQTEELIILR